MCRNPWGWTRGGWNGVSYRINVNIFIQTFWVNLNHLIQNDNFCFLENSESILSKGLHFKK